MPRHSRSSFGTAAAQPLHSPLQPSSHHIQPSYGLLEPQPAASQSPPGKRGCAGGTDRRRDRASSASSVPQPAFSPRRPPRRPGSFGRSVGRVVPAWDEVEAGFDVLKDCGVELGANLGAFGGKLSDNVPGVRGSVAFLSILRSNIQLSAGVGPPSPRIQPASATQAADFTLSAPPLSQSSIMPPAAAKAPETAGSPPPGDIPELVYETPRNSAARVDALRLVADSVAQMRQSTAAKMLSSPLSLAILVAIPTVAWYTLYGSRADLPVVFTTSAGFVMALLLAVRMLLKGYIQQAESINWNWLGDDEMLVARFGTDIIGTVVYRIVSKEEDSTATSTSTSRDSKTSRRKISRPRATGNAAELRAWTVRRRERGHGVGKALLEAAVKFCVEEQQCDTVQFAEEWAGSRRVLPVMLSKATQVETTFAQREAQARSCLAQIVEPLRQTQP